MASALPLPETQTVRVRRDVRPERRALVLVLSTPRTRYTVGCSRMRWRKCTGPQGANVQGANVQGANVLGANVQGCSGPSDR